MSYTVHSIDSAPAASKDTLTAAAKAYGFLPNLMGVMAEAPAALKAYPTLIGLFDQTSFSPTERQIVLLATSVERLRLLRGRAYRDRRHAGRAE